MGGFVYAGKIGGDKLKAFLKEVFGVSAFHILYSTERIAVGEGTPPKLEGEGCAFNGRIEVRWSGGGGEFAVLALSDDEEENCLKFGLSKVEGDWETETLNTYLQDLGAPSVNPNFKSYPRVGRKGRLTVRVFKRGGKPALQSPRGFIEG